MEDIKKNFSFSVKHQTKNYRVGLIQTHRGEIDTPAFMPVGTQGTVKGIFTEDIKKSGPLFFQAFLMILCRLKKILI